jgi:hypothetical protein
LVKINPYEVHSCPSENEKAPESSKNIWRWIPMLFSAGLGLTLLCSGLVIVASMVRDAWGRPFDVTEVRAMWIAMPVAACGGAWISAAWLFWRRRFGLAATLNIAGIAFLVAAYFVRIHG